jgi:hypothetical protein
MFPTPDRNLCNLRNLRMKSKLVFLPQRHDGHSGSRQISKCEYRNPKLKRTSYPGPESVKSVESVDWAN